DDRQFWSKLLGQCPLRARRCHPQVPARTCAALRHVSERCCIDQLQLDLASVATEFLSFDFIRRIFMIRTALLVLVVSTAASAQTPKARAPSPPLGQGRPDVPGIPRTSLKEDAKTAVTRVHFAPGAEEPPHTHPYDVILVPVLEGTVEFKLAGKPTVTSLK